MNEAREKTVEQIFAEQRKLWETGNALYPHKDTLRLGYDAGYDSRDAEVAALIRRIGELESCLDDMREAFLFDKDEGGDCGCVQCSAIRSINNILPTALSSGTQEVEDER